MFSCAPTNLLVDDFGLSGREEVFPPGFSVFLFDNTPCYLVFTLSSPLPLLFKLHVNYVCP